jgi:two-component system LytT family response regulator
LLNLIKNHTNTFNVIATCNTVEEAIEATKKLQPELVFLDIKIHDKTGFEYLEQLDTINFKVVFTTAFNNYAIKAFKYSALDYLLKPIDSDDFSDCISRIKQNIDQSGLDVQIKSLLNNLKKEDKKKTITIPTANGFEVLEIGSIIYCQADTSYTYIYTTNNKILVSKPLKFYDDLLSDNNFYRIHNSHLININHVKKYTKGKGGFVTMSNKESIDVSTRKKEGFLKLFTN